MMIIIIKKNYNKLNLKTIQVQLLLEVEETVTVGADLLSPWSLM